MKKTLEFRLSPKVAFDEQLLKEFVLRKLKLEEEPEGFHIRLLNRSLDARKETVKAVVKLEVYSYQAVPPLIEYTATFPPLPTNAPEVIVVGAGPAGYFAALRLMELGVKPIILERGKNVSERTSDIANINRRHVVNPNSNYCFGEGGAGTYSDGKLYTRSKKRGSWRRVLEIFVAHGANENILYESHPHIGTNKLPRIISHMRANIVNQGGEVRFDSQVTDFILEKNEMKGVVLANGEKVKGAGVILATGHSARDIFELLDKKKIKIEAKPFAIGVRIEHQQKFIDQVQYHCEEKPEYLPASSYSLVANVKYKGIPKGVFSFCMCPGGFMVPSATKEGEVVVNGMSPSRRNSKYANSGIVSSVDAEDWGFYVKKHGALAGMRYQEDIEKKACKLAGGTQTAPAQRVLDFVEKRKSETLLETSYQPGLKSVDMFKVFPYPVAYRLRKGLEIFGKKMKGYISNDAQIVGVETRTSSPVRIPRDPKTCEHPQIKNFFPCGEGAGYAGGIMSAAIDGMKSVDAIFEKVS